MEDYHKIALGDIKVDVDDTNLNRSSKNKKSSRNKVKKDVHGGAFRGSGAYNNVDQPARVIIPPRLSGNTTGVSASEDDAGNLSDIHGLVLSDIHL